MSNQKLKDKGKSELLCTKYCDLQFPHMQCTLHLAVLEAMYCGAAWIAKSLSQWLVESLSESQVIQH